MLSMRVHTRLSLFPHHHRHIMIRPLSLTIRRCCCRAATYSPQTLRANWRRVTASNVRTVPSRPHFATANASRSRNKKKYFLFVVRAKQRAQFQIRTWRRRHATRASTLYSRWRHAASRFRHCTCRRTKVINVPRNTISTHVVHRNEILAHRRLRR